MLKVKQQLRDIALRLNNGQEIDWKDNKQGKYCITLDFNKMNTLTYFNTSIKCVGEVYCLSEDFLDVAIQEIGEEKLIELIKSGV